MYTSILWIALTGVAAPEAAVSPEWISDYTQARRDGVAKKKPLAVFLAPGRNAWEAVSDGKVSDEARKVLAQKYVCVFVDTASESGKTLAKAFEINSSGLIISDRTGNLQAFCHDGKLPAKDVEFYLERYSDPERVVRDTETHSVRRTSSYAEPSSTRTISSPSYCPS